jgi:hypothetical protein
LKKQLQAATIIEVEGGIHSYGCHNRSSGFFADSEKYLEATLLGWRAIRLTKEHNTPEILTRIKNFIEDHSAGAIMGMLN